MRQSNPLETGDCRALGFDTKRLNQSPRSDIVWWGRRESNPHAFRHMILSRTWVRVRTRPRLFNVPDAGKRQNYTSLVTLRSIKDDRKP